MLQALVWLGHPLNYDHGQSRMRSAENDHEQYLLMLQRLLAASCTFQSLGVQAMI